MSRPKPGEEHTTVTGMFRKLLLETNGFISHEEALDYTDAPNVQYLRSYTVVFRRQYPHIKVVSAGNGWIVGD